MAKKGLILENYREIIALDTPFVKNISVRHPEWSIPQVIDEILAFLNKEAKKDSSLNLSQSVQRKRSLIYSYLTIRPPKVLPKTIVERINYLLQLELKERPITKIESIPSSLSAINAENKTQKTQNPDLMLQRIGLWQGDITTLQIDSIVNAANSYLLGCFQPFHKCIDNVIHDRAGPQVRFDCHKIIVRQGYNEPSGSAKITRAYNLPSKYIIHTVGPIWNNNASDAEQNHLKAILANCYTNCLNLALEVPDLHHIAFCSISTGVFGFPIEVAAEIAVKTVIQWLKNHSTGKHGNLGLEKIIFNVFSSHDYEIYEKMINNYWKG